MATLQQLLRDLRKMNKEMKELEEKAPRIAGVEAVRWINGNFTRQGYKGKKWAPRSSKTNKGYDKRHGVKGSVFNSKNPILIQTGNLKDSIRYKVINRRTYVGFDTNKVPYGVVHNEGGTVHQTFGERKLYFYKGKFAAKMKGIRRTGKTVAASTNSFQMPQRQFMPKPTDAPEPELTDTIARKINFERDRILSIFKK